MSSGGGIARAVLSSLLSEELQRLWYYGPRSYSLRLGNFRDARVFARPRGKYFQQLANRVPDGRRLDDEVLSFFAEAPDRGHLQFEVNWSRPEKGGDLEFRIIAPTIELSEQLASAMLLLVDYGLSGPTVEHVSTLKRTHETELSKIKQQQTKAERRRDELVKQLEAPPEVNREDLATLKTQTHLLNVDLAGVMARLKAVAEILSHRDRLAGSRIEQVENIKITAEIDMAGLASRQDALQDIIDKGTTRVRLEDERTKTHVKAKQLERDARTAEGQIRIDNMAIDMFGPLPLINDEAIIRPIRWGKST